MPFRVSAAGVRNSPALMHKNKTNQTNRGEKRKKEWKLISCSNDISPPFPLLLQFASSKVLGSHAGI